jgi:hypothetical protein
MSEAQVRQLASMSRLSLSQAEVRQSVSDLKQIIGFLNQVKARMKIHPPLTPPKDAPTAPVAPMISPVHDRGCSSPEPSLTPQLAAGA